MIVGVRAKTRPPTQVRRRIDGLGLTEEWVAAVQVFGLRARRVASVAANHGVDDVAAQTNERPILVLQIQRHRRDLETNPNLRFVAIVVSRPQRANAHGPDKNHSTNN